MTPHHPLWLWTTPMDSTRTRLMLPKTTASTSIPLSTQQTAPGSLLSNVSTQSLVWHLVISNVLKTATEFQFRHIIIKPVVFFVCPALSLTDVFPLAPPRPATPEKFTIPHRCARFGPGGHLVQVLPNLPSAGQPALVDIHNMEVHF